MNVKKNIILFAAFATILNAAEITDRASIIYNSCAKNSKDIKISNHELKNIDSYAKLMQSTSYLLENTSLLTLKRNLIKLKYSIVPECRPRLKLYKKQLMENIEKYKARLNPDFEYDFSNPKYQYTVSSHTGVNVRDTPVNGKIIDVAEYEQVVTSMGKSEQNGFIMIWFYKNNTKVIGWIASRFLAKIH